jgi:hypothetical protein
MKVGLQIYVKKCDNCEFLVARPGARDEWARVVRRGGGGGGRFREAGGQRERAPRASAGGKEGVAVRTPVGSAAPPAYKAVRRRGAAHSLVRQRPLRSLARLVLSALVCRQQCRSDALLVRPAGGGGERRLRRGLSRPPAAPARPATQEASAPGTWIPKNAGRCQSESSVQH